MCRRWQAIALGRKLEGRPARPASTGEPGWLPPHCSGQTGRPHTPGLLPAPLACCPRKQGGSRAGCKVHPGRERGPSANKKFLLGLQQRGARHPVSYIHWVPVLEREQRGSVARPWVQVPHPPPTNPGEDHPDSRTPRGLRTTSPLFLLTFPRTTHPPSLLGITPTLLCAPQTTSSLSPTVHLTGLLGTVGALHKGTPPKEPPLAS